MAHIDFPASPSVGQKYPASPIAGMPTYTWDGEKWTTTGALTGKTPVYTDGTTPMAAQLTVVNPPVAATDAAAKGYVDTGDAAAVKSTTQTLTDDTLPQTKGQKTQARQNIFAAPFDALAYNGLQINGTVEVAQDYPSLAAQNVPLNNTYTLICDQWQLNSTGTTATVLVSHVADTPPGFSTAVKFTVQTPAPTLGATEITYTQTGIEGYRIARLQWGTANAQPITVSIWVKAHRTGTYSGAVYNRVGTRSYVFPIAISVADTWEYKTVTVPGCTTGAWDNNMLGGIYFSLTLGTGSTFIAGSANTWLAGSFNGVPGGTNGVAATSDVFLFTGLTIHPGLEAPSASRSPFIHRSFNDELKLCQRYYVPFFGASPAGGGPLYLLIGAYTNGLWCSLPIWFPVTMRAVPTCTEFGTWTTTNAGGGAQYDITKDGAIMYIQSAGAGLVQHYPANANAGLSCSSRLV